MLRKVFGTLAVVTVLCVGAVLADEIKGKVTKVDQDGNKITVVKEDGTKVELTVTMDTKYPEGKNGKTGTLKGFAKQVDRAGDKGVTVTVTTEKKDGKETVTEIKRRGRQTDKPSDKPAPPATPPQD
jgi:hypothetical protein